MGIFDKLFGSDPNAGTGFSIDDYSPKSEQEAFVAIMYACLSIDGEMSQPERDMLARIAVFKKPFFGYYDYVEALFKPSVKAYTDFGSKTVIDFCVSKISEENKAPLLCFVLDIALSDGVLDDSEKNIIEYLISRLEMDDELASKIIEVMMYKNKWNVVITD